MSGRVAECGKCGKHWNVKFNRRCPRCGTQRTVMNAIPAAPEDLQKLKEYFNG